MKRDELLWGGFGAALFLAALITTAPAQADEARPDRLPPPVATANTSTPVTITGEIVEASCYLTKGPAALGPAHRDCAIKCLKEGRPPLVHDEATGKLYLATFPDSGSIGRDRWLRQVGNRVRVTGSVQERGGLPFLEVKDVRGEHDHAAAPHGGVVGMSGNRHVEVVSNAGEPLRVYVLDEFMKPLPVSGVQGKAVIRGRSGPGRPSALIPDTTDQFLRLRDTTRQPSDEDVTVTLDLDNGPLTMTLPFRGAGDTEDTGDGPSHSGHHAGGHQ